MRGGPSNTKAALCHPSVLQGDGFANGHRSQEWPEVVSAVRELLPQARPWSINQWRWVVG
jgi:hypothetical protein